MRRTARPPSPGGCANWPSWRTPTIRRPSRFACGARSRGPRRPPAPACSERARCDPRGGDERRRAACSQHRERPNERSAGPAGHDEPRARARRAAARAGRPHAAREPDFHGDGRADGPGRRAVPRRQPRAGADGAPRRDRPHRARLRLGHAGLLDHPGVLGARLQDPVGAEGQLADGQDEGADLRDPGRHPGPGRPARASRHAMRARCHQAPAAAVRRRGRDHRQDHGPVVARLPHVRRRAVPAHVARRPGQDEARAGAAQGGDDRLRQGADRGRRRRAHAARPRHRRPGLGRVLPPLPARHAPRVRRGARRADHPAHLRAHGGPHGLHRRDRHGGVPLRLQERRRRVDGRRSTGASASSATSTIPRRCTPRARPRCATRFARTSRPASRWSGRSARSRCRRRSRTCSRSARPSPSGTTSSRLPRKVRHA